MTVSYDLCAIEDSVTPVFRSSNSVARLNGSQEAVILSKAEGKGKKDDDFQIRSGTRQI